MLNPNKSRRTLIAPNYTSEMIVGLVVKRYVSEGTSRRLIISGPPYIRSIGPVRAIAGVDTTIACPYSGYPITSVEWSHGGVALPLDIRHRVDSEGHLTIANVDPNDAGTFTCMVRARSGETASRDIRLTVSSEYSTMKNVMVL